MRNQCPLSGRPCCGLRRSAGSVCIVHVSMPFERATWLRAVCEVETRVPTSKFQCPLRGRARCGLQSHSRFQFSQTNSAGPQPTLAIFSQNVELVNRNRRLRQPAHSTLGVARSFSRHRLSKRRERCQLRRRRRWHVCANRRRPRIEIPDLLRIKQLAACRIQHEPPWQSIRLQFLQ
jgi:hypothetical protein